ncbi:MAG TPA: 3-ketoacyl-ACP reductase [Opitutaceae bacterium]|jgi:NAD(P)-dependent dehydrogenase (short-subunit alcohol dehydrogenase family)
MPRPEEKHVGTTRSTRTTAALVTGASRGLGRGIALQLAQLGCSVALGFTRNESAARETAGACAKVAPGVEQRFVPIKGDVSQPADRQRMVDDTLTVLGGLDVLVNNAGVAPPVRADILEATEASFEEVLRTNLQGPYFLTQAVARYWHAHPLPPGAVSRRKVVFVTSISANTASVSRGDYCVSKAGLSMAAQLWAARLAPEGIEVVEVRPGIMATDMTSSVKGKYDALLAAGLVPQMRWGNPDDVGRAVRAIVAGDLGFSSGAVIAVDGGFNIRRL